MTEEFLATFSVVRNLSWRMAPKTPLHAHFEWRTNWRLRRTVKYMCHGLQILVTKKRLGWTRTIHRRRNQSVDETTRTRKRNRNIQPGRQEDWNSFITGQGVRIRQSRLHEWDGRQRLKQDDHHTTKALLDSMPYIFRGINGKSIECIALEQHWKRTCSRPVETRTLLFDEIFQFILLNIQRKPRRKNRLRCPRSALFAETLDQ